MILSGSIGSPHILQVSGIGETNKLKNLGIEVFMSQMGLVKIYRIT